MKEPQKHREIIIAWAIGDAKKQWESTQIAK